MSLRTVLHALLDLLLGDPPSEPATQGESSPAAAAAEDATAAVSPSQAVTVSVEHPPAKRPSHSKSRKPLPWPARDALRLHRPPAKDDVDPRAFPPPADGPDVDDVTVVVPSAGKDEALPDPDVTVVWRPDDAAGRPLP